jgi:DMSO/TMAO reductase YedYZ molybdopterin-dependent catalytic subunit
MISQWKFFRIPCFVVSLSMAITFSSCESKNKGEELPGDDDQLIDFPAFITPAEKYFDTRIADVPDISSDNYQLKISGMVDNPASFTLGELKNLVMVERTLTIECIGNGANGNLLGTASWKGFRVYDLLESLGIQDGVSTVKYICADGYYTFNSIEELQNSEILGALYMNGDPIPPLYGYPLRIIFPGYYGVRQPGWIVEMELLDSEIVDYWSSSGWHTDSAMSIDSKIFFPPTNTKFPLGESVRIGGTAYGSKRISSVEITLDDGKTWMPANELQSLDQDYVWIFWDINFTPPSMGNLTIRSRATAQDGSVQPESDREYLDGTNSWPSITITITEGS